VTIVADLPNTEDIRKIQNHLKEYLNEIVSKKQFFHKKVSKNCPSGGAGDILFRK